MASWINILFHLDSVCKCHKMINLYGLLLHADDASMCTSLTDLLTINIRKKYIIKIGDFFHKGLPFIFHVSSSMCKAQT